MVKKLYFALLFTTIGFCPVKSIAQKIWTLENCIDYAMENNLQIKREALLTEASENSQLQSKLDVLPSLNSGATQNFSFGRSIDPFTNEFISENVKSNDFYLQSSVVLFHGLQKYNKIQEEKYNFLASIQKLEHTKNNIILYLAGAYLDVLFNEELLEVANNQLELIKQQVDKTTKLVEVGNLARGDLLELQAQQANEQLNQVMAENNLNMSYLSLAQLLDLDFDTIEKFNIHIPEELTIDNSTTLSPLDSIYKEAVTALPQIKSAEYSLESSKKSLAIAKGMRSPELSLSSGLYTGYSDARERISYSQAEDVIGYVNRDQNSPVYTDVIQSQYSNYLFSDQIRDNSYKRLGFTLSIPIFNGWQTETSIANAKIGVLDASLALEQTKKDLYQEIQQAHADAIAALEKYNSSKEAVAFNEEAFNYSTQKFEVGLVSSVDYNVAKNNLMRAKSNLVQAKYEYIFKSKILDFYTGKQIVLK